ncbi:MAG: membrane protein insertase YidC [Gammaproteobacteria bacterium]|nr:membrane protein insertase YidC [Gammaproteobacteria bacterium]
MELRNMFLWAALGLILMLMYQQWQVDYGPQPVATSSQSQSADTSASNNGAPSAPVQRPSTPGAPVAGSSDSPASLIQPAFASEKRIRVRTDVLDIELDTRGGDIRQALLPKYPVAVDKPDEPFRLMGEGGDSFIAQSGLVAGGAEMSAPNHHAVYTTSQNEYSLADGSDRLEVVMSWQSQDGLQVNKTYTFQRGSYLIDIRFDVVNNTGKGWQGYMYRQLQRSEVETEGGIGMLPTYTGGVYSGYDKGIGENVPYEKWDFDDMEEKDLNRHLTGGWTAMIQHYFLVAMIPGQEEKNRFYSLKTEGNRYAIGMIEDEQHRIASGTQDSFGYKMLIGPKDQDMMEAIAPNLQLTVDYGFTTIIAEPLFWVLKWIYSLVGNWGWAIVVMTILLKAAFYKLQAKSFHSMAKMRKLTPRIQQLKDRYGDDKQKLQQAMMEMWKTEKVNPMSGCLPVLIQMPIFLAFYWVLLESVELRQADWILWYADLSIRDPYYVLPILMGVSMFIQFKLNPAPADPIQAKVMMFMPVMLSVLFFFFPAGLVLYWTVNNILQIIQQYIITKRLGAI